MNCLRFLNIANNTTITNTYNVDNGIIANIKKKRRQIMRNITYRILKFKPMIKKQIVANYTFFTVIVFSDINSLECINSIVIQHL